MDSTIYNYAIIGAGCAGIHLAIAMMEDSFFADKQILVLEKEAKETNDRTWCFWENDAGKWNDLISKSWSKGRFYASSKKHQLDMSTYQYKMLRSIDFYNYGKNKIREAKNFHWINDSVTTINSNGKNTILGEKQSYQAKHIFDSRIHPDFYKTDDRYTRLLQHFKGWIIETEEDAFDPDEFVIMDFRLKWKDSTSFNYVLPLSKRKALIEFTLFTDDLIADEQYDQILSKYLSNYLAINNYQITEVEKGVIPMSDFPFHHQHQEHLTKIGTAGAWVRPSSGYSFKNAEKYSRQLITNIKNKKRPSTGIARNRFRKYDSLLLDILKNKNELGEEIFSSMFAKNQAKQIFKFLDEETSILEDIKIISSFRSAPFLRALFNQLKA